MEPRVLEDYPQITIYPDGRIFNNVRQVFHKTPPDTHGYPIVNIRHNGKPKRLYVHRLVAAAFLPNPLGKPYVNHIDRVKSNSFIPNLEWCTMSENRKHDYANGLQPWNKGVFGYKKRKNK